MITLSVKGTVDAIVKELNRLQREVVPKATARALNRTITTVNNEAARAISKRTGMGVRSIKEKLRIYKAGPHKLVAEIVAPKHAPNLIRYGARRTKKGVSAKAWNQRKVYKHTFIANDGRTVFARVGKARLPIKPIYGPSLPRTFVKQAIREVMEKVGAERFPIEFTRELRFLLSGGRK